MRLVLQKDTDMQSAALHAAMIAEQEPVEVYAADGVTDSHIRTFFNAVYFDTDLRSMGSIRPMNERLKTIATAILHDAGREFALSLADVEITR